MMPDLMNVLEVLEASPIAIKFRQLGGRHVNRESRLDLLVDMGYVDWQETSDRSREIYRINARGLAFLARYRHIMS